MAILLRLHAIYSSLEGVSAEYRGAVCFHPFTGCENMKWGTELYSQIKEPKGWKSWKTKLMKTPQSTRWCFLTKSKVCTGCTLKYQHKYRDKVKQGPCQRTHRTPVPIRPTASASTEEGQASHSPLSIWSQAPYILKSESHICYGDQGILQN